MKMQLVSLCFLLALLPGLASAVEECHRPIPDTYSPVCVSDGSLSKTLQNKYVLDEINCEIRNGNKPEFNELHKGECEKTESKTPLPSDK